MDEKDLESLRKYLAELKEENRRLRAGSFDVAPKAVVSVPEALRPLFDSAQTNIRKYFKHVSVNPGKGTIEIGGERYIMVRAPALSIHFLETILKIYGDRGTVEAQAVGRSLLFDIAHTIGMNDARDLHRRLNLVAPLEKLSAGPVHFAYTGWAFVNIRPESSPVAGDDFVLIYDHPYSFEADSWLAEGRHADLPVCTMNAGYSSGWCEESFGISLTAVEVFCRARGDAKCTFVMAPPGRVAARVKEFFGIDLLDQRPTTISVPAYFERKTIEEMVRASEEKYRRLVEDLTEVYFFYRHDASGVFTYVSPSVTGILGYAPDEFLVNFKNVLTDNPSNEEVIRHTELSIQGVPQPPYEVEVFHKDGSRRTLEVTERPVRDKSGKTVGVEGIAHDVTEWKRANDALRESEEKFRALADNSPDVIMRFDRQHRHLYVNAAVEKYTGIPAKDFIGKTHAELNFPENLVVFWGEAIDTVFAAEIPHRIEFEMPNGTWIDWLLFPEFSPTGEVTHVITSSRDISERKQAEEALRESERRLADILQFYPDPTMVINRQGRVTAWNRAIEKLSGVKAEDMLGKGDYEYALPFYGERRPILVDLALRVDEEIEKRYAAIERSGDIIMGEAYTPRLGGEIYLYATATALRNAEGQIVGAIESIRDITERKQAEVELKRERDFRRTLIEASPTYFVAIRGDGTVLMMNQAMLDALGYSLDQVVGKNYLSTFVSEAERPTLAGVFASLSSSREPTVNNNHVLTASGSELLVEWHGRSIFKENGDLDYFFGIGVDMTARKEAEDRLQQTMEELRRSNRELEDFAYVASHDLQEPLRKVRTFGDRLKAKYHDVLGADGVDYLARMQSAAERMQNLINDLLSYSRVTSQAKPFEMVDLNTVLAEVLDDLEVRIRPGLDRVEVNDLPSVEADRRQIQQLLHNLLANALKFRKPGESAIVKVEGAIDKSRCCFRVKDNGIGFDEKYKESIFGIFKRLHSRSEYEGTGVGLAICKKIVERHGGTITASGTPGAGATFEVSLPVRQAQRRKEQ